MNRSKVADGLRAIERGAALLAEAFEEEDLARPAPAAPMPGPILLTLEQAAEQLAVGQTFLRELVDAGRLQVVRLSDRAVRIPRRALEQLIADGLAAGQEERARVIASLSKTRPYKTGAVAGTNGKGAHTEEVTRNGHSPTG